MMSDELRHTNHISFADNIIIVDNETYPIKILGLYDDSIEMYAWGWQINNFDENILVQQNEIIQSIIDNDVMFDVSLTAKTIADSLNKELIIGHHRGGFIHFLI